MTPGRLSMLIEELLSCEAVRFGDFTLTSGKKSRYYVDIKRASCNPDILSEITDMFSYEAVECDKVAGVELGAVPLVVAYSLRNKVPLLIIRKKGRDHGTRKMIVGDLKEGDRILLLEDVVTSGGSVLGAIDLLEEAGASVVGVLSVVDREEGGTEPLNQRVDFRSLVKASDLLEEADRRGF